MQFFNQKFHVIQAHAFPPVLTDGGEDVFSMFVEVKGLIKQMILSVGSSQFCQGFLVQSIPKHAHVMQNVSIKIDLAETEEDKELADLDGMSVTAVVQHVEKMKEAHDGEQVLEVQDECCKMLVCTSQRGAHKKSTHICYHMIPAKAGALLD
mmetsp:Transcript_18750/g.35735  ORF Transcript_18750/g.35735 Transcript_18750/m.35735 type:complete len:152 (+) Transcript_18750:116-571(+)